MQSSWDRAYHSEIWKGIAQIWTFPPLMSTHSHQKCTRTKNNESGLLRRKTFVFRRKCLVVFNGEKHLFSDGNVPLFISWLFCASNTTNTYVHGPCYQKRRSWLISMLSLYSDMINHISSCGFTHLTKHIRWKALVNNLLLHGILISDCMG